MSRAVIVGAGARTPLGFDRHASVAAVRADISAIAEHPYMIDRFGAPMKVTRDPGLEMTVTGPERLAALAIAAIREAVAPLLQAGAAPSLGLAFSVGETRRWEEPEMPSKVAKAIEKGLAPDVTLTRIVHAAGGHAGGILAMDAACALLDKGVDIALAGGVDSYLEPDTLEWLDDTEQLHSEENVYGFCPGEAAGFLALARADTVRKLGLSPLAVLTSVGAGKETNLIKTEDICLGEGLSAAFKGAAAPLGGARQIDRILCDMNGERYRGNEYGFAVLKTPGLFRDAADFEAPADCWGDVGAASGPLYAAMVIEAEARGYSKGPLSLIWASSEAGRRAAAILSRVEGT